MRRFATFVNYAVTIGPILSSRSVDLWTTCSSLTIINSSLLAATQHTLDVFQASWTIICKRHFEYDKHYILFFFSFSFRTFVQSCKSNILQPSFFIFLFFFPSFLSLSNKKTTHSLTLPKNRSSKPLVFVYLSFWRTRNRFISSSSV